MIASSPFASPFVPFQPNTLPGPGMVQVEAPAKPADEMPMFVNYVADMGGCGHWRVLWPEKLMVERQMCHSTSMTRMVRDPLWYKGFACVKIQRQATSNQLEFVKFLKEVQKTHKFKLIYEIDDVVFAEDIPNYNKFKPAYDTDVVRQNCIDIINLCDEVIVTCDYMKEIYKARTGKKEITVIPNFLPRGWIHHLYNEKNVRSNFIKNKAKPRILYTGSGAHYDVDNLNGGSDDFEDMNSFVEQTRHKYQWVFIGAFPPRLYQYIKDGSIEFHPWQSIHDFPAKVASLNVQLMIAPLQDNNFNKSKSDIKFLEAAILGIPCLCQNLCTYDSAPDYLKFNNVYEFEDKMKDILNYKNKSEYFKNIRLLHEMGEERILENDENIGCHFEVLTTPYKSNKRKYLDKWN